MIANFSDPEKNLYWIDTKKKKMKHTKLEIMSCMDWAGQKLLIDFRAKIFMMTAECALDDLY